MMTENCAMSRHSAEASMAQHCHSARERVSVSDPALQSGGGATLEARMSALHTIKDARAR